MGAVESQQQDKALTNVTDSVLLDRVFLKKIALKLNIQEAEAQDIKEYLNQKGYTFSNRLLGKTPSTKILRALNKQGKSVAIKILKCNSMKDYEKNQNEFKLMKLFNSDYIIKVQELLEYRTQDKLLHFLIMERCLYDLHSQLMLMTVNQSHPDIYKICLDLIRGLQDIHNKNTVHLDIKPHNIVLGADNKWKFIDMGISNQLSTNDGYVSKLKGLTLNYCSPEQYQQFYGINKVKATKSSDTFSLGLVFLKLTGVTIPKSDVEKSKQESYNYVSFFNPKFPELNIIINQMLSQIPDQRPQLIEIEENLKKIIKSSTSSNNLSPLKQHRKNNSSVTVPIPMKSIQNPVNQDVESSFFDYKKLTPLKLRKEAQFDKKNTSFDMIDKNMLSPVKSSLNLPKMSQSDQRKQNSSQINLNKHPNIQKFALPQIQQRSSVQSVFQSAYISK
ncbi:kinase domain protein (macronuclear) [Tetrahymena thermophila SB210]|uniref:Kinase domain protein n=1 Tax=Tetrahymena thermophila (strain SB210) TaxID=312017 RepID=I7MH85_TETTS|nr:kinase domain protein [Tetrahymena thermophila SB210]EAR87333.2 kinase domain protein [Tetrahymena thermophila SB210]|eukprot:XP_001007578.2 kinase domain protein [Tetrahymena thermophila SB210]